MVGRIVAPLALLIAPLVSLGGAVQYQYDDAGRLRRVVYSGSSNKMFVLDAAGNRTQVLETLGRGVLQFSVATAFTSEASFGRD